METTANRNTAAMIHLSALTQYIIPFGNFIFPIIIWSSTKDKSEYINVQGKRAINFHLSLLIYSIVLCLIAIPILLVTVFQHANVSAFVNHGLLVNNFNLQNITGIVGFAIFAITILATIKIAEFFLIIYASVKSSNGEDFNYPISIPFLK